MFMNIYNSFLVKIGIFDRAVRLESCIIVILYIDLNPGSSKLGQDFLASIYSNCEVINHLKIDKNLKNNKY